MLVGGAVSVGGCIGLVAAEAELLEIELCVGWARRDEHADQACGHERDPN